MLPNTKESRKEFKYRLRREEKLKFIKFKQSIIDGTVYDFKINKFLHQETICTKYNKKNKYYYLGNLSRNNHREKFNYKLGDNDFYWFWIPDSTIFYVIPELILYQNGFISKNYNTDQLNHDII
jgi:hypothetical protein